MDWFWEDGEADFLAISLPYVPSPSPSSLEESFNLVISKSPYIPLCKGGLRGISPNGGCSTGV